MRQWPGVSVTELELRHGVTPNPKGNYTLILLRNDDALASIPDNEARKQDFLEADPQLRQKLVALRNELATGVYYSAVWNPKLIDRNNRTKDNKPINGKLDGLDKFGKQVEKWLWESIRKQLQLPDIKPRTNVETGKDEAWLLKDLRKTCATYYDAHVPESSIEILGHSVGGVTYRHYAHRAPLAFKAIMTLPQPTAFMALVKGYDGECPCCRRPFADA